MHHQAGGLVEHQQRRVLVDDVQRQRLGRHGGLDGKLRPHHESLAAADPVAGPHRPAVDADGAERGSNAAAAPGNTAEARRANA